MRERLFLFWVLVVSSFPPARYERRVGAFLVRAAWERRPEGPAYLLSILMPLYLAGQCAFFCTHTFPLGSVELGVFFGVPADGFFLQFLNFEIPDLSPLAIASSQQAPQEGSARSTEIHGA